MCPSMVLTSPSTTATKARLRFMFCEAAVCGPPLFFVESSGRAPVSSFAALAKNGGGVDSALGEVGVEGEK